MKRLFFAICLFVSAFSHAADLTPAQLTTLKTAIEAETDPDFVGYRINGQNTLMAAFYNVDAVPDFYIWRKVYTPEQIGDAIETGISQLDNLTVSKRDSLLWWAGRQHDMSMAPTRAAVNDLCGSQNTLKNAIWDGGKRKLTRGERLFATGVGSLASPGAAPVVGAITDHNISQALAQ